jgi:hypothetical protein
LAAVVSAGAIPALVEVLKKGRDKGKAEAARALCNLCANEDATRLMVVRAGALPPLVRLLRKGAKNFSVLTMCSTRMNVRSFCIANTVCLFVLHSGYYYYY